MHHLMNVMRLQTQRATAEDVVVRIGTMRNYDPNYYAARVILQPDGIMTGLLPIAAPWVGNGWGMLSPPQDGALCLVAFIAGDIETGIIIGALWNDEDRPLAAPSGEFWLVHQNGQSVKLTNDGKLTVSDGQGATVTLNGDGTITSQASQWDHTGPINVTGISTRLAPSPARQMLWAVARA